MIVRVKSQGRQGTTVINHACAHNDTQIKTRIREISSKTCSLLLAASRNKDGSVRGRSTVELGTVENKHELVFVKTDREFKILLNAGAGEGG